MVFNLITKQLLLTKLSAQGTCQLDKFISHGVGAIQLSKPRGQMEKIGKIDEQMAMTAQTLLWDKPQSQKNHDPLRNKYANQLTKTKVRNSLIIEQTSNKQ